MSSKDSVERLECSDVLNGREISRAYANRIADFAFTEISTTGGEKPGIAKWSVAPRILVRADAAPRAVLVDAIWQVQADLEAAIQKSVPVMVDLQAQKPVTDGDLVVYMSWAIGTDRAAADRRRARVLRDFYGSEVPVSPPLFGDSRDNLHFADVVLDDGGAVRRAIVAIDQPYAHLQGQASLLEMMTTVLNPNPGNAINLGLPGSTPQEKRIYEVIWRTQADYDLTWTREFQAYLRVLFDPRVVSASGANDFRDDVGALLNGAAFQAWLRDLYDCAP
jgi:hypothetical protein